MTRRTLLGVGTVLLSGCSLEPMTFSTDTAAPTPAGSVDPTVTLDPEFYARAREGAAKTLPEGTRIEQRFSTPHLDGTLGTFFVGQELSAATMSQMGRDSPVRAPAGYELAAIIVEGGRPTFSQTPENRAVTHLRIGDRRIEVPALFDNFSEVADVYLMPFEMIAFCLPTGAPLALEISDAGKNIHVDLRTGVPVEDDGWRATTGFREKSALTFDPLDGVFTRTFSTRPAAGREAETGGMMFGVAPVSPDGLRPWTPLQGWAPEGGQWLTVEMNARVKWEGRTTPEFILQGPESFTLVTSGERVPATQPESITADELMVGQAELVVVWPTTAQEGTSTIEIDPVGELRVDYADAGAVAAEFTSPAEPLLFTLTFAPQR